MNKKIDKKMFYCCGCKTLTKKFCDYVKKEGKAVYTTTGLDEHWEAEPIKIDWEDGVEYTQDSSTVVYCASCNDNQLFEVWVTEEVFKKLKKDVKVNPEVIHDYLAEPDKVVDKNTLLKLLVGVVT